MFVVYVSFLTRQYNYLNVQIFVLKSQELPLKKQAPEKKMALTGCPKSNSTMTLSHCNFHSEHEYQLIRKEKS